MPGIDADEVVKVCLQLYSKLPKSGKPIDGEWTVLSCILKNENGNLEVVSLGTGSKCIGASKMSSIGDILNDSHAEVFARRGFLLYLYDNIDKEIANEESIFVNINGRYKLKEGIDFIFYSSQLPCGDASIIPKSDDDELFGDIVKPLKRQAIEELNNHSTKFIKLNEDVHRTGAKCLPNAEQDPKNPGSDYHVLGQVRTKPGRGDRTLSVSCSDKMAKWIHMGIQGSLLSLLLQEPIYLKYYIFGSGVPFSIESLKRAFLNRGSDDKLMPDIKPQLCQSNVKFPHVRNNETVRAAPGSIVWIKGNPIITEVAVMGKKLGVTKKKASSPSSSLCISKYNLYSKFVQILNQSENLKQLVISNCEINNIPYNEMKRKSTKYINNWTSVKEQFFKAWTAKPDIWDFCVR